MNSFPLDNKTIQELTFLVTALPYNKRLSCDRKVSPQTNEGLLYNML